MKNENFKEFFDRHSIIAISETHIGKVEDVIELEVENFQCFPKCREKSANGVYYGGLCLYIKKNIMKGVQLVEVNDEYERYWIRLDKQFFSMKYDVFVCFAYIRPEETSGKYGVDTLDIIEKEISVYSKMGKCALMGDLNGHTSIVKDFIINDDLSAQERQLLGLPDDYQSDHFQQNRNNCDVSPMNAQGRTILDLCISTGMRILNGRTMGDIFGKPTYFGPQCIYPTTLDYTICHEEFLDQVSSFKVSDFTPFSDHCQISTNIKTGTWTPSAQKENVSLNPLPDRFVWDKLKKQQFIDYLENDEISVLLNNYMNTNFECTLTGTNNASKSLCEMLVSAADPVFKRRTYKKRRRKYRPKYFDLDCTKASKELRKLGKLVSSNHQDRQLRHKFYKKKKDLKRSIKHKIKVYKDSLINGLNDLSISDAQDYWKIFRQLDNLYNEKTDDTDFVPPEDWVQHFKKLMIKLAPNNAFSKEVEEFLGNKDNWKVFNELSFKITNLELTKAIGKLKSGKSCGEDMILNEMLKASKDIIGPALVKLFNHVLICGVLPDPWCLSFIKPLHKGGSKRDPNCYRGISIMSCLGKLFFSVLNKRLGTFLKEHNLNTDFQIGFSPGSRPSDHILTLKTISDKYLNSGKKVYCCFVDFSKAFDTVWRNGLMFKLLKKGIGGPFGQIIQNMYAKSEMAIKLPTGTTETFMGNVGVKQGCVMSPTLFNFYISDIPDLMDDPDCDPVILHNLRVACLMFADDIVLISESADGLQNSLNKLQQYCEKWMLSINTKKTQVLVMNKQGRCLDDLSFTFNQEKLHVVNQYKYLGLLISSSGSFTKSVENLSLRAMKAMFKIKNVIHQSDIEVKSALHLFDTLVRPIATYSCEVWGAFTIKANLLQPDAKLSGFDELSYEKLDLRFCKNLLGVHRKTTNAAVRGDLGRFPISLFIMKQVLKNWLRVAEGNCNSVLQACYLENINLVNNNKTCWLGQVKNVVLNSLGFQEAWNNLGSKSNNSLLKKMYAHIKNVYKLNWNDYVTRTPTDQENGNKLRTYMMFKNTFRQENYLKSMSCTNHRKYFTRLRISAHNLKIETGRHTRPKTPVEKRVCNHCNEVDDELHFMLICNKKNRYVSSRQKFINDIKDINPTFTNMNNMERFVYIMSAEEENLCNIVSKYVGKLVNIRGSL